MLATSSGLPTRPSGMSAVTVGKYSSNVFPTCLARPPMWERSRSVRMRPGQTVLIRMLSFPSSAASVLDIPATPGRIPLDRISPAIGCLTELDWMLRIRPPRLFLMRGGAPPGDEPDGGGGGEPEGALPIGVGHLIQTAGRRAAGVRDQDIHAAE